MAGKSEHEEGTEKYSVRLPPSVAQWCIGLGGTLGKGIVEAHRLLTEGEEPEPPARLGIPETEAESVIRREKYGDNIPGMGDNRSSGVPVTIPSKLPPIYNGSEDVTPRFKENVTRASISPARRPVDSQVVDYGDDDAQPLPAYDF